MFYASRHFNRKCGATPKELHLKKKKKKLDCETWQHKHDNTTIDNKVKVVTKKVHFWLFILHLIKGKTTNKRDSKLGSRTIKKKVTWRLFRLFLDLWLALARSVWCPAVPAWQGEHRQGCQLSSTAAWDSRFWVRGDAFTHFLPLRVLWCCWWPRKTTILVVSQRTLIRWLLCAKWLLFGCEQ